VKLTASMVPWLAMVVGGLAAEVWLHPAVTRYVVLHMTGIDTQQSPFYDFWSGIAPALVGAAAVWLAWRSLRLELTLLKSEHQAIRRELQEHRAAREDDYDLEGPLS
jgi:ABC-type nickel/cobalt efflux system permease component RcnA